MRLICPNCAAQYEIDATLLPEKGRDVECSRCGQVWFQPKPAPPEKSGFDPDDRPALNRTLSDSVLSVLREEAARELRAREEDRARAAAERSRFKAEAFAPAPAHGTPLPEFPFAPDSTVQGDTPPAEPLATPRTSPATSPSDLDQLDSGQIDWPATTITDERILEAPTAPDDEHQDDEWVVAAPAMEQAAGYDLQPGDPAPVLRDDQPEDADALSSGAIAEDEPVATIISAETDRADDALALPADLSPATSSAKASDVFVGLPNDLPGDSVEADQTQIAQDQVTQDMQTRTPAPLDAGQLPISVDSQLPESTPLQPNGYGRGFGLAIGLAAALAGFYLIAPSISGPGALGGFAAEYRATADQGRIWIGEKLDALTGQPN